MRAAVRALNAQHPASSSLFRPLPTNLARTRPEVDEFVALMTPEPLYGVGEWYEDFADGDAEVLLLERARSVRLTQRRGQRLNQVAKNNRNR
jgi:putative phosphoribosyl transferase